jgi:hypothetical protein
MAVETIIDGLDDLIQEAVGVLRGGACHSMASVAPLDVDGDLTSFLV